MMHLLYNLASLTTVLAQVDDADAPAGPPPHHMSFSDLQKGLQVSNNGDPHDRPFQMILLVLIAVIAVIALILHLRQRKKTAGPANSTSRLARELARKIPFPFGTRLLLGWVARTCNIPMATLMLSARTFDHAVETWSAHHTFALIRHWGRGRLALLRPILFDAP